MAPAVRRKARPARRKARSKIPKAPRLRQPPLSRRDVTRAEYNYIIEVLNQRGEIINGLRRELEVQLKRIGQLQSELDEVRTAWQKSRRPTGDDKG